MATVTKASFEADGTFSLALELSGDWQGRIGELDECIAGAFGTCIAELENVEFSLVMSTGRLVKLHAVENSTGITLSAESLLPNEDCVLQGAIGVRSSDEDVGFLSREALSDRFGVFEQDSHGNALLYIAGECETFSRSMSYEDQVVVDYFDGDNNWRLSDSEYNDVRDAWITEREFGPGKAFVVRHETLDWLTGVWETGDSLYRPSYVTGGMILDAGVRSFAYTRTDLEIEVSRGITSIYVVIVPLDDAEQTSERNGLVNRDGILHINISDLPSGKYNAIIKARGADASTTERAFEIDR